MIHDGQLVCDVSPKAAALFKAEPGEMIGRDIFEIIPLDDMRELARLRMNHILTRGELSEQELPLLARDGSVFWAIVKTRRCGDGTFISTLEYLGTHSPHYRGT
jgi:PAS domain S-box-containing protein